MAVRLPVEPDENLDEIIARLKNYNSQDVMLVLPNDTHALQDLNSFTTLRNAVRTENINLTIAGGNKTIRALANLLGFAIEKPLNPGSGVPSAGQGTVVRPDYSGVADGFVATSPQQTFTRPEQGFPVNVPAPAQSRVVQPAPLVPPQNFAGNPPGPGIPNNPADNRQPVPPSAIKLTGSQAVPARPSTENQTRNGFFNPPELGKMDATFQSSKPGPSARPSNDFEPLPGFLEELVEDDNAAGQFRARQSQPAPRPPVGAFFDRKKSGQVSRQPDAGQFEDYEIEEVPDPDADLEAAPVAASGSNRARRSAPTRSNNPRMRPVAGAVAGPAVTPKGGVGVFLLSGDRRTTMTLVLAVLFAILLVVVLFLLLVKPGGIMTLTTPQAQTLTVPLKTEIQTNTIRLELVSSGGGSTAPTAASSATAVAGTNSNPAGTPGATATAAPPLPATLPVEMVNTGEIKKSGNLPATGARKVPDQPSRGPVVFYNRSFSAKSYGAGTVIYTRNGVTYRLVRAITIDGSTQFNGQAGQATGEVVADKAGTVGNIAELVSFPLNENVGVGLGPLTTGTDRNEKFITQGDQDALKKQLQDQARAEVSNALKYDQTTQGVFVIKTTDPVCTFPQKVNDTADTVNGSCTTSLEAARYRTADVAAGAATHFVTDPTLQLDSQTQLEFVGAPKLVSDQGRNFMEVQVRGRVIHLLDADTFKTAIAGKTRAEVPALIASDFPQVDLNQLDLKTITGDPLPTANLLIIKTVLDYEMSATRAQAALTPSSPNGATTGATAPTLTPKS